MSEAKEPRIIHGTRFRCVEGGSVWAEIEQSDGSITTSVVESVEGDVERAPVLSHANNHESQVQLQAQLHYLGSRSSIAA